MRHIANVALLLSLGVTGIYAQPSNMTLAALNMTLSGTGAPSTVNLGTGTGTSEYNLAGNGALGSFTFRTVSASAATAQQSSTCSGSGKGAPEFWVARVKPGRILFEVDGVSQQIAREALTLAAAKLPIKTRFVQRIAE